MKCPKCGYLGFETSDRCRNCGYDFSLTSDVTPLAELPLHSFEGAGAPLEDFVIADRNPGADSTPAPLDLDRVIGTDFETESPEPARRTPRRVRDAVALQTPTGGHTTAPDAPDAPSRPGAPSAPGAPGASASGRGDASRELRRDLAGAASGREGRPGAPSAAALPLFGGDDDTPLITAARPPRPPLSVRRTTPEIPRSRARTVTPRQEEGELAFPSEGDAVPDPVAPPPVQASAAQVVAVPAATPQRLTATVIDLLLLGTINVVVLYLTLALTGLSMREIAVLPLVPLVAFLALLDGGYLVAFIAAGGQTIGKMVVGIRVTDAEGHRVELPQALLRAIGCGISLATVGLGYLPAFTAADRRALQDRIAGTRVVSAR